jgi:hypothetical protein
MGYFTQNFEAGCRINLKRGCLQDKRRGRYTELIIYFLIFFNVYISENTIFMKLGPIQICQRSPVYLDGHMLAINGHGSESVTTIFCVGK